ncbi:MAG: glutamine synthetase, partial [Acidimicrobiales bacterium]|nr:glutamine synthetase [Acidimicrobiales bacterium]
MPGDPHHPFDRVRVLWADHLGLPRGKYIAARNRSKPTGFCVTTFAMAYDRDLVPAPHAHLLTGLRDVDALVEESTLRPGWEDARTGVALCDLTIDGEPYPVSGRNALKQAIADWKAAGYDVKVGLELEGYILEPTFGNDGRHEPTGWQRFQNPRAMVYGTGPLGDPSGLLDEIWWTADRCGFTLESMNVEFDESQVELTLEY